MKTIEENSKIDNVLNFRAPWDTLKKTLRLVKNLRVLVKNYGGKLKEWLMKNLLNLVQKLEKEIVDY